MKRNENKKSNKKLLTVAALALLLGFVGYSGGSTFAKYVTSDTAAAQTATVAKWGVVVSAQAENLFSEQYFVTGSETLAAKSGTTLVVKGSSGNLVAPGTTGYATLQVSGTPEVNYYMDYKPLGETTKDICIPADTVNGNEAYYPIKWQVVHAGTTKTCTTISEVHDYMKSQLNNRKVQAAGTEITTTSYTISWSWAFDNSANDNILDTYLGDYVALDAGSFEEKYGHVKPTLTTQIEFGFSLTVEQTQKAVGDIITI